MTKRSTGAVLRAARAFLDDHPTRWLSCRQLARRTFKRKTVCAVDRKWMPCDPRSASARRWTMAGAIAFVCPGAFSPKNRLLVASVGALSEPINVQMSDTTWLNFSRMIAAFDDAIRRARRSARRRRQAMAA